MFCILGRRYVQYHWLSSESYRSSSGEGGTNIVDRISKWINVMNNQNPSHELIMLIATMMRQPIWVCGALLV